MYAFDEIVRGAYYVQFAKRVTMDIVNDTPNFINVAKSWTCDMKVLGTENL